MDLSYEDGQLLMRALEGHAARMVKIAESENMLGHVDKANVAATEARNARTMINNLKANGVRIT